MHTESGTLAWNNVHAYAHREWHNLREHVARELILPSKLILKAEWCGKFEINHFTRKIGVDFMDSKIEISRSK